MNIHVVDTDRDCTNKLAAFKAQGITTIIRYYYRAMTGKVIRKSEAQAFAKAGMRLGIVYEGAGDKVSAFSDSMGYSDAAFSRKYGSSDIGQPAGSVVWFAVDFDANGAEIRDNIIPYFRGVARAFSEANNLPKYRVGVYGSGAVCKAVKGAGLAELTWITCSTGWTDSKAYIASGQWDMLQHLPTTRYANTDTDPDEVNEPRVTDIGDFIPFASAPSPITPPTVDTSNPNFPPKPSFPPLVSNDDRARVLGKFSYVPDPQSGNPEHIKILGTWEKDNIVWVPIPQMAKRQLGEDRAMGGMLFHRLGVKQLLGMWDAWDKAGLLDRVLEFSGSFSPRFVRGSSSTLSNHAFGSAFDINVDQNQLGHIPALVGSKGSVRELVPIANQWGFFWGGHYSGRPDGMHFELAKILSEPVTQDKSVPTGNGLSTGAGVAAGSGIGYLAHALGAHPFITAGFAIGGFIAVFALVQWLLKKGQ